MYMYKIKDIVEKTGLKDSFVRRCVREMQDIFDPYVERGAKNSFIFDSNVIPIFKKIEQDKENGLSLLSIKKNLLNNSDVLSENDLKTDRKTTKQHSYDIDEWLSIKDAANISKKSEATIRRLIVSEFKDDSNCLKRDESSKRGKWLINKQFLFNHFNIDHVHDEVKHKHDIGYNHEHDEIKNDQTDTNKDQLIELLGKQIEDLKKRLSKKDAQLEKQADDFKIQAVELKEQLNNLLSQKDQQIHQLHVLLKESKISTIDYKPDDKVGVFSKVLMRFGL